MGYGKEARAEVFEVRMSRILPPGTDGEVRTREKWYVPIYRKEGDRVLDRNVYLAYDVDYTLKKANGRWRIVSTSTPYAR